MKVTLFLKRARTFATVVKNYASFTETFYSDKRLEEAAQIITTVFEESFGKHEEDLNTSMEEMVAAQQEVA